MHKHTYTLRWMAIYTYMNKDVEIDVGRPRSVLVRDNTWALLCAAILVSDKHRTLEVGESLTLDGKSR